MLKTNMYCTRSTILCESKSEWMKACLFLSMEGAVFSFISMRSQCSNAYNSTLPSPHPRVTDGYMVFRWWSRRKQKGKS